MASRWGVRSSGTLHPTVRAGASPRPSPNVTHALAHARTQVQVLHAAPSPSASLNGSTQGPAPAAGVQHAEVLQAGAVLGVDQMLQVGGVAPGRLDQAHTLMVQGGPGLRTMKTSTVPQIATNTGMSPFTPLDKLKNN